MISRVVYVKLLSAKYQRASLMIRQRCVIGLPSPSIDGFVQDIYNNAWVTVNDDFCVTSEANDFHKWRSHDWKSLASRITRNPKIVIHGNEFIILYVLHKAIDRGRRQTDVVMLSYHQWSPMASSREHFTDTAVDIIHYTVWKLRIWKYCFFYSQWVNSYLVIISHTLSYVMITQFHLKSRSLISPLSLRSDFSIVT